MTGKEILEEEFERAGIRGYKAEQVDAFLQTVASYVDDLNSKNEDLNYKLQILANKIEEYKSDEENIREALLGAQKLGTSILNEAKSKAETTTREAKAAADEMLTQAKAKIEALTKESKQKTSMELSAMKRECEMEQRNLERMKQDVSNFKAFLLKQYKAQLQLLTNLPTIPEEKSATRPEPAKEVFVSEETGETSEEEKIGKVFLIEEDDSVSSTETISSDILPSHDELEEEEKEQTKEFGGEASEEESKDGSDSSQGKHSSRPNYIEKFGELKFGGFTDSAK